MGCDVGCWMLRFSSCTSRKYSNEFSASCLFIFIDTIVLNQIYSKYFVILSFFEFTQQIKEIKVNEETTRGQIIKKCLWYISISRNALIVLITSAIGYNWTSSHMPPFKLSGKIQMNFDKKKL